MEHSTSASSSKVTVEYTDPSYTYPTISQGLSRRLPLRNLHWNSSSRPLRSIKSLHVELVPDDKRSSQIATPEVRPQDGISKTGERPPPFTADSSARKERRHQIPGLRQTPYLKIYLLRCDDIDTYKASSRKLIREWVKDHTPAFQKNSKYNTQENHDAFEWLILHVVSAAGTPSTSQGTGEKNAESRLSKRSSSNLIEKIRTDFNGTSKSALDRVAQVYIFGDTARQSPDDGDTGWADMVFKMKYLILGSFDLRVRQYEEDIRERESQRSLPGWNFNTFFVLKEGLAMGFESVGLIEDALTSYQELDVGLQSILEERYTHGSSTTSTAQLLDYNDDMLTEVKFAAATALGGSQLSNGDGNHGPESGSKSRLGGDLGQDILSTDRKPFRDLILANKISAFDFQCYIFARQAALLLRMGNAKTLPSLNVASISSSQPVNSDPFAADSGHEPENLLVLADVCQRAVEFITSACRTMRNELSVILKTGIDGKEEGSIIQFPSQETVVENLIASWTYSTTECVLSQTSTQSLSTQLQPLIRQLRPQRTGQAGAKSASSPELPRRTSSLSPATSTLQRPPSPEKFPSVTSLDAMRLLPPGPVQTGAQDLAADRAALYALQRRVLSHVGFLYGAWKSGWPDMHLPSSMEEHQMEEISLDEGPDKVQESNGIARENHVSPSLNGVRNEMLRGSLSSEGSFYTAYDDLTASTLALNVLGERKKSAEALTADLASVRFHLKDYAAAASYFRQLAPFYAQGQWSELELVMLDLYAQCLERLDRKEEYVSIALKIVAKQVKTVKALPDDERSQLKKPLHDISRTSQSYLQSLLSASKSLDRQVIAPIERFFGGVLLNPQIQHSGDCDNFCMSLNIDLLVNDTFSVEEVRVGLVKLSEEQRTDLWLTAADVTIAARQSTKITVVSSVMNPGLYRLEKITLRSANVVFQQDLSTQAPQVFSTDDGGRDAIGADDPSASPINVYPGPQALKARVLHTRLIHLEQPRSLEILISAGRNDISGGKLLIRAGTAGLRLHTARSESLTDGLIISNSSQPGIIEFGNVKTMTHARLGIPYTVESELKDIVVKLEVSYTTATGSFTFVCSPKISILLPLGVNVQDVFRQDTLFSKFSIFTSSSVPLRLLHCQLEGTAAFKVHSPPLSGTEYDVFARQPLTLMARVCCEQAERKQKSADTSRRLLLQVRYTCLDEEVLTAIEQAFTDSLQESDHHNLLFLLRPHLLATLRLRLSVQDYEAIALLREIAIGPFSSYNWQSILASLPHREAEAVLTWLSAWHTSHSSITLPDITPSSHIHHLRVPVEIPQLQILLTAHLRPLITASNITLNQALVAELTISHTRRWGTDPAPVTPLSFVYEAQAPPDTWLIGGQRKAHFTAKEDEKVNFTLLLLPQRTGKLLLPAVEIRVVDEDAEGDDDDEGGKKGSAGLTCETDHQSQTESVEVVTGLESTTVSLDGGGGGVAWVLETRERAV